MTIREKMNFIMENEHPKTLKIARQLARYQWDVICDLLDQKKEAFAAYEKLEDRYKDMAAFLHKRVAEEHKPDKIPN